MGRLVLIAGMGGLAAACSLSALDGFSSPSVVQDGGVDAADGGVGTQEAGSAPTTGSDANGGGDAACTGSSSDFVCSSFDQGPPESGWSASAPVGSYTVVSEAFSLPNALAFTHPNASASATVGPQLGKLFSGPWSTVRCTFQAALDEVPTNGTADLLTLSSGGSTLDDVTLRMYSSGFRLTSCRDSSDCKSETNAGPLPTLAEYHAYDVEWTASGELKASIDGQPRGSITTKTTLSGQAQAEVRLGVPFRVYGAGGAFRVRVDDVYCRRGL